MKSEDSSQRSMPGFDLLDLTLFVAVVRAGSITHGAREVHLALPSASARIRAMETALGTSLLAREHRGVRPTPAGHLLLRHARSVLHGVDHLREDLANTQQISSPPSNFRRTAPPSPRFSRKS